MAHKNTSKFYFILLCGIFIFSTSAAGAADAADFAVDLSELSLEDLMSIEVTSVSKKEQKVSSAPAAIFVITANDIHRSGASSIPEVLRMVPGLHVAQMSPDKWAITARGFNGLFANKLLVLIDGRSSYTPLFSGVYWDAQDTLLKDIERIEIIRGPGAALWGANAVNGVINVITKSAHDTLGGYAAAGGGTEEEAFGEMRYGVSLGENSALRAYGKIFSRDNNVHPDGEDAFNEWEMARGGFRLDSNPKTADSITFQGDIFTGNERLDVLVPLNSVSSFDEEKRDTDVAGMNVLGRWQHTLSETSNFFLQTYYDRIERLDLVDLKRNTFDFEFQYKFLPHEKHEVVWGLGYRYIDETLDPEFLVSDFAQRNRNYGSSSGFIQDEIELIPEKLYLTLGAKLERHKFSGFEFQPNARLAWHAAKKHFIWASAARAARTPARANIGLELELQRLPASDISPPVAVTLFGNPDNISENLAAYEIGYRYIASKDFAFDCSIFANRYTDYTTIEASGDPFVEITSEGPLVIAPYSFANSADVDSYGVEAVIDYKPLERWRLQATYSFVALDHKLNDGIVSLVTDDLEHETPKHMTTLRSMVDLPYHFEFDAMIRYLDSIGTHNIDSYVEMDARLAWHPKDFIELSIVGKNLLNSQHAEYNADFVRIVPTEIERSVYGKITIEF